MTFADFESLEPTEGDAADTTFDAVVVGARCAGAPVAIQLARGGWKVAVVDKARFPSDTLSTHVIFPDGLARLDDLGALKELASSARPRPGALLVAGAGTRGGRFVHADRRPQPSPLGAPGQPRRRPRRPG